MGAVSHKGQWTTEVTLVKSRGREVGDSRGQFWNCSGIVVKEGVLRRKQTEYSVRDQERPLGEDGRSWGEV